MEAVAPSGLKADVKGVVSAYRAAGKGDLGALRSPTVKAQRARMVDYRKGVCSGGSGSGDQ